MLGVGSTFLPCCACTTLPARSNAESTPQLTAQVRGLLAAVTGLSTVRRSPVDLLLFLEVSKLLLTMLKGHTALVPLYSCTVASASTESGAWLVSVSVHGEVLT